jgi:predicted dehydrogenase/aryl-alcohol dehydrogenase-like predicted oxidoreductase
MPDNPPANLAWGIIGTGMIANAFADQLPKSRTGRLVAVASREQQRATDFARKYNAASAYAGYDALLADRAVQAVYISTPHPSHAEWAIKAARAGKHILVEKPIGLNQWEAMAIVEAATENDVFMMEAFMYRCHPLTRRLIDLIAAGTIGHVQLIEATFSFNTPFNPAGRHFDPDLGGGGILDVGCYTASLTNLIAQTALNRRTAEPITVAGAAHIGQAHADEYATASLSYANGIIARLTCGVSLDLDRTLRVFGADGRIEVPNPWTPGRHDHPDKILVYIAAQETPQEILIPSSQPLYALEADTVAAHIAGRQAPEMTWDDSIINMRTLDRWRDSIGLTYPQERTIAPRTHRNRPLAVEPRAQMKYASLPGLSRPVSRLIIGVDNQDTLPQAQCMFDDFFERGGNTFDTAYAYHRLRMQLLAAWADSRGVRDQINVIVKGGHTPHCNPASITAELLESLDHLKTDHADIYMLHRDNPLVPVDEFIDLLNAHARAGRISVFGASNWSTKRLDEANAYATAHGLAGFSLLCNQFSLARPAQTIWPGSLSASDPGAIAWLTKTKIPLVAWSSQARGFFARGRAAPDNHDDIELVRCWYSDENFQRLARATELADRHSVDPTAIALAYVLAQPFPTFALIGPRQPCETRTTARALNIDLSADELRYLDLES